MAKINSVLGPLDTSKMGFTLAHEHIISSGPGIYNDYPELLGANPMERVVDGLKITKKGGVDTICDLTTTDLGRDVKFLAEASRKSGVNIIATTGWWLDVPRGFNGVSADQLAELFVKDVTVGIAGTDIKAGILKGASDMQGVTRELETVLRAVARAYKKTGVPIVVHSYSPGRVGIQQVAILKEEGVPMNRVKFDHSNDTTDIEYLTWILEQGCYLGLDRYPGRNTSPFARTKTLKALIDAGYKDRLCVSHDSTIVRIQAANPEIPDGVRLRANPHGFLYIKNVVFPMLREMGLSEKAINDLFVVGPRNFFEGK